MSRAKALAAAMLGGAVAALLTTGVVFADDRGFGGGFRMHHRDGFGVFMFFPLLLLIAAVVLAILLFRGRQAPTFNIPVPPPSAASPVSPTHNAQVILADRLARGEITPEDYRAAIAVLREPPPAPPAG